MSRIIKLYDSLGTEEIVKKSLNYMKTQVIKFKDLRKSLLCSYWAKCSKNTSK